LSQAPSPLCFSNFQIGSYALARASLGVQSFYLCLQCDWDYRHKPLYLALGEFLDYQQWVPGPHSKPIILDLGGTKSEHQHFKALV
jgi:hypothetical protein